MKKDFDTEALIGGEIGVLNDDCKEIKKIKITKAVNTKNGLIVFDEDGNPYHENELNWSYRVTPEFLLYDVLDKNGFEVPDWNADLMGKVFKEFMDGLVRQGYVSEG